MLTEQETELIKLFERFQTKLSGGYNLSIDKRIDSIEKILYSVLSQLITMVRVDSQELRKALKKYVSEVNRKKEVMKSENHQENSETENT